MGVSALGPKNITEKLLGPARMREARGTGFNSLTNGEKVGVLLSDIGFVCADVSGDVGRYFGKAIDTLAKTAGIAGDKGLHAQGILKQVGRVFGAAVSFYLLPLGVLGLCIAKVAQPAAVNIAPTPTLNDSKKEMAVASLRTSLSELPGMKTFQKPQETNKKARYGELVSAIKTISGNEQPTQKFIKNVAKQGLNSPMSVWAKKEGTSLPEKIKIGKVTLSRAKMEELNKSVVVTFDDSYGLDSKTLKTMLLNGASTPDERSIAKGRMVGQKVVAFCNTSGEPITLTKGQSPPEFHVYSTSAPDLRRDATTIPTDYECFFDKSPPPRFKKDEYKKEIESQMKHFLSRCQRDGVDVPVLSGFGLGQFLATLDESQKVEVRQACYEAMFKVIKDKKEDFKGFVFADERGKDAVSNLLKKPENTDIKDKLMLSKASVLDVAIKGAENGLLMGILNAGDPSCYNGQDFETAATLGEAGTVFAQDELLHTFTSAYLSNNPHLNTTFGDTLKNKNIERIDYSSETKE